MKTKEELRIEFLKGLSTINELKFIESMVKDEVYIAKYETTDLRIETIFITGVLLDMIIDDYTLIAEYIVNDFIKKSK